MLKLELVELAEVEHLPTGEDAEEFDFFYQDYSEQRMVYGDSCTIYVGDWQYDEEMWHAEFNVLEGNVNRLELIRYFVENDISEMSKGQVYEF